MPSYIFVVSKWVVWVVENVQFKATETKSIFANFGNETTTLEKFSGSHGEGCVLLSIVFKAISD